MSVRPMKAVGIIGLSSELDKVMRYCGESEIFHPDDAMNFYENTGKVRSDKRKKSLSRPIG